jgi:cytosine/creatinine deaminase
MATALETFVASVIMPDREGRFSISLRDGRIAEIEPERHDSSSRAWLALPGFANLHAHADRTFTVTSFRPRSFADALAASAKARAAFTSADVERRATIFLQRSVAHGVSRVRTHTDVDPVVALKSMEGVLAAKRAMAGKIDVDVIAFSTSRNDLAEPEAVARLRSAIALKPDFLGLSINSSSDPERATAALLDLAEQAALPVDLHIDEHLEPDKILAPMVVKAVEKRGLGSRVTFSHLCALATLDKSVAGALIDAIAKAGITVIALPETNLFLQDRSEATPRRRGVTLVRELLAAGVKVRFGTDNVRDWFFPFGDGDMLDTALFTAVTANVDKDAQLIAGLCDGRATLVPGDPADFVLVPASSIEDALARRPAGRIVFKAGRQVAGPSIT